MKFPHLRIFVIPPFLQGPFQNQPLNLKPRSGRERGLHERATRAGLSIPCPITWISIPMKTSAEDDTLQMTQWPILQPYDFVSQLYSCLPRFCFVNSTQTNCPTLPQKKSFLAAQADAVIREGYLSSLVADVSKIPLYWQGMLADFPQHPVQRWDPGLSSSLGCTLYGIWE